MVWLLWMQDMRKLVVIFSCFIIFFSCKKENGSSDTSGNNIDDCIEPHSVSTDTIAGQYIIGLKEIITSTHTRAKLPLEKVQDILTRHHIGFRSVIKTFGLIPGGTFVAKLSPKEVADLANDETVSDIEQDRTFTLGNCFTVVAPWLVTWNIDKVGFGDGTGKVAWVIDSGIDFDHPDLNVDKTLSKSFVDGIASATDENGHGTHVAGVIAAKNNDFGVLGVASGATVVSLRVMDKNGDGVVSSIIEALDYVGANGKPGDVVNISIGEDGASNILDQHVKAVAAKGIFVTIAAGNDGKPVNEFSPARVNAPNVYTIAAVDSTNTFASFSNYGSDVIDYAAPGVKILSTYKDKKYAIMSGTSMAAPHVAGLLLLKGKDITTAGSALDDPGDKPAPIAHK